MMLDMILNAREWLSQVASYITLAIYMQRPSQVVIPPGAVLIATSSIAF